MKTIFLPPNTPPIEFNPGMQTMHFGVPEQPPVNWMPEMTTRREDCWIYPCRVAHWTTPGGRKMELGYVITDYALQPKLDAALRLALWREGWLADYEDR